MQSDQEQLLVARFIESVIHDARYMADMTGTFLQANGFRPAKKSPAKPSAKTDDSSNIRRAKACLLNLAAALRIASWERSGLRSYLPDSIPSFSAAIRDVIPPESTSHLEEPIVPKLSLLVFRTWIEWFSRSSRAEIGADVVLPIADVPEDELLDAVADFLWQHRHLTQSAENKK